MQKTSKSLSVFVFVIIIFAVGYFGVYGQWNNLSNARDALNLSKEENTKLKAAQAAVNSFLDEYNRNRDTAELANRALPMGDEGVPSLLENISRIASEGGLNLVQINLNQGAGADIAPPPNTIQSIDADVIVTGSFEAFENFLIRIQRNLRLLDIVHMTVSGDEQANDQGRTLKYTLKVRAYYQP